MSRKQRVVIGVSATVAGLVMFMVASAFIVARGWPHWLAAGVGALAFPVAPVGWHVVSERRRRKKLAGVKVPPKAALTGGDRFWLRMIVVAVLVIGPMVAIAKFGVVRAVWHHGLWFWPTSYEPVLSHGSALSLVGSGVPRAIDVSGTPLARVPADAELVISVQPPDTSADGRAVLAWGDRQLLVVADGKLIDSDGIASGFLTTNDPTDKLAELNNQRSKVPWLPIDELIFVKQTDALYIAASPQWRFKVDPPGAGPNADLLRELGRAPKDALFAAAFVPKTTRDVLSTRAGAAWMVKRGDKLSFEGRVLMNSETAAKQLVDEAKTALDKVAHDVPQSCREETGRIIRSIELDQTGTVVTGRLDVEAGSLIGVALCAFKDHF